MIYHPGGLRLERAVQEKFRNVQKAYDCSTRAYTTTGTQKERINLIITSKSEVLRL